MPQVSAGPLQSNAWHITLPTKWGEAGMQLMQVDAQREGVQLTAQLCSSGSQPNLPCSMDGRCIDALPVQP